MMRVYRQTSTSLAEIERRTVIWLALKNPHFVSGSGRSYRTAFQVRSRCCVPEASPGMLTRPTQAKARCVKGTPECSAALMY